MSESTTFNNDQALRIQEELGQNVHLCYQCVKCTSGCPVTEFFEGPLIDLASLQLSVYRRLGRTPKLGNGLCRIRYFSPVARRTSAVDSIAAFEV